MTRIQDKKVKAANIMINSEELSDVPRIDEVFDTISQKKDGTITPCSPVVIKGVNLICNKNKGQTCFYLLPNKENENPIPIEQIYHAAEGKVVIFLPNLSPGDYQPMITIKEEGQEIKKYPLPLSWTVKKR